ncbi:MAG: M56 family metallopeptidase [Caulobacterales bacterium]|jgi:beta-lactamase regulating signal transducer with metallopeptidase domain
MSEVLGILLRVNLAAATAVGLAMLLRRPIRRLFGARLAYGLWSLVPLAGAAMVLPARRMALAPSPSSLVVQAVGAVIRPAPALFVSAAPDLSILLCLLWLSGGLVALAALVWRQARFARAVSCGRAGPAVVGVLCPRIVTPDDFSRRYTPREQLVVLAHERTHIARQDSRINALVALVGCVNWFNPLVHLLAHNLRIDQELACDAQVVAAHPGARRAYAAAMLKTQLAARPLPFGCYWPAQSLHPLTLRIDLLSRRPPGRAGHAFGVAVLTLLALGAAAAAWAIRPADVARAAAAPGPPEAPDDPARAGLDRRLLPPGFFGPSGKDARANWSSVAPGSTVHVLAATRAPDGVPLTTEMTVFGSQARYQLRYVRRDSSHYRLFTSVAQHGDRLRVTAGVNRNFHPLAQGTVKLASGESGRVQLSDGRVVTVTATVRPETPQEAAEARGPARVDVSMSPRQF